MSLLLLLFFSVLVSPAFASYTVSGADGYDETYTLAEVKSPPPRELLTLQKRPEHLPLCVEDLKHSIERRSGITWYQIDLARGPDYAARLNNGDDLDPADGAAEGFHFLMTIRSDAPKLSPYRCRPPLVARRVFSPAGLCVGISGPGGCMLHCCCCQDELLSQACMDGSCAARLTTAACPVMTFEGPSPLDAQEKYLRFAVQHYLTWTTLGLLCYATVPVAGVVPACATPARAAGSTALLCYAMLCGHPYPCASPLEESCLALPLGSELFGHPDHRVTRVGSWRARRLPGREANSWTKMAERMRGRGNYHDRPQNPDENPGDVDFTLGEQPTGCAYPFVGCPCDIASCCFELSPPSCSIESCFFALCPTACCHMCACDDDRSRKELNKNRNARACCCYPMAQDFTIQRGPVYRATLPRATRACGALHRRLSVGSRAATNSCTGLLAGAAPCAKRISRGQKTMPKGSNDPSAMEGHDPNAMEGHDPNVVETEI